MPAMMTFATTDTCARTALDVADQHGRKLHEALRHAAARHQLSGKDEHRDRELAGTNRRRPSVAAEST
jgi:hypothetical protein